MSNFTLHELTPLGHLYKYVAKNMKYAIALRKLHVILARRDDPEYAEKYTYFGDYVEMSVASFIKEGIEGLTTTKAVRLFFAWCKRLGILFFKKFGSERWYQGYSIRMNPNCKYLKDYFNLFSFAGQVTLKVNQEVTLNKQDLLLEGDRQEKNEQKHEKENQQAKQAEKTTEEFVSDRAERKPKPTPQQKSPRNSQRIPRDTKRPKTGSTGLESNNSPIWLNKKLNNLIESYLEGSITPNANRSQEAQNVINKLSSVPRSVLALLRDFLGDELHVNMIDKAVKFTYEHVRQAIGYTKTRSPKNKGAYLSATLSNPEWFTGSADKLTADQIKAKSLAVEKARREFEEKENPKVERFDMRLTMLEKVKSLAVKISRP